MAFKMQLRGVMQKTGRGIPQSMLSGPKQSRGEITKIEQDCDGDHCGLGDHEPLDQIGSKYAKDYITVDRPVKTSNKKTKKQRKALSQSMYNTSQSGYDVQGYTYNTGANKSGFENLRDGKVKGAKSETINVDYLGRPNTVQPNNVTQEQIGDTLKVRGSAKIIGGVLSGGTNQTRKLPIGRRYHRTSIKKVLNEKQKK